MNRFIVAGPRCMPAVLLLALTACKGALPEPPAPAPFTAPDAGFAVTLRGKPALEKEGPDGNGVVTRTYSVGTKDLGGEYGVIVFDFPESIPIRDMAEGELMKLLKEALLDEFKGTELGNRYVQLDGRRAREFEIGSTEFGRVHARVLIVDQRVYAAMTASDHADEEAGEREAFFASFKLTDAPPPQSSVASLLEDPPETPAAEAPPEAPAASSAPAEAAGTETESALTAPDRSKYESYTIKTTDGRTFDVDWFDAVDGNVVISMGGGEFRIPQSDLAGIVGRPIDDRIVQGRRSAPSSEGSAPPREPRRGPRSRQ